MKMKSRIFPAVLVLTVLLSGTAQASTYVVLGTTLSIYAQSTTESTAHLIQSSKGIYNNGPHPWCVNRAYIDLSDRALLAAALAASYSGKSVNFIYEDAAAVKTIAGHTTTNCKVISIFQ